MKALIFDMDGVMIDSEIHWGIDERSFIKGLVTHWDSRDQARITGMSPRGVYELLCQEYGLNLTWEEYKPRFDEVGALVYSKAQLLDGFLEFIKSVKIHYRTAVASSADKKNIKLILDRFNLHPLFNVVVSAEDIKGKSKPVPDIYLHTAKKLGVDPCDCVVIEDAQNGVLAAKAAGMICIGLRNGINHAQDLSAADQIAEGFKNLKLRNL